MGEFVGVCTAASLAVATTLLAPALAAFDDVASLACRRGGRPRRKSPRQAPPERAPSYSSADSIARLSATSTSFWLEPALSASAAAPPAAAPAAAPPERAPSYDAAVAAPSSPRRGRSIRRTTPFWESESQRTRERRKSGELSPGAPPSPAVVGRPPPVPQLAGARSSPPAVPPLNLRGERSPPAQKVLSTTKL